MTRILTIVLITLALFLMNACSSSPTIPESEEIETTAYPYPLPPQISDYSPYPEPQDAPTLPVQATDGPIPEPKSDSGVVTGLLLIDHAPATNAILYLAAVSKDDQGTERIASYDRATSPRAYVDPNGRFVFADIPAGKFGLILDIVIDAYLLHDPDTSDQFLFTVINAETTDLGELNYKELPYSP